MAGRLIDEAFAQHLLKTGIVTEAQLSSARQAQDESATQGKPMALGAVLVRLGVLTAVALENIEKTLETHREEAKHLGPFLLLKKLGEGGMGAVYLAKDSDGKKVALKVLSKVNAEKEEALRRFMREVDAARKLDHPNIVRAGASGEDRGFHYYVMEYVEGETLGKRLKRERLLPWDKATMLVIQVAHGLKFAHKEGFIHRDIKPDNVIQSREGVIKILDMGLSKNIDEAQSFRTVPGKVLGTPAYMAPEQAQGDQGVDWRADIYSLGATYYHLVTGKEPFEGTPLVQMMKHVNEQSPDPREILDEIPDGVVHIIRRMMAKMPGDRYEDCSALIADLELVLGKKNPSSRELEPDKSAVALRATMPSKSGPAWLVVGGVAAAVVLGIVMAVASGSGSTPSPPPNVAEMAPEPEPPKPRVPEKPPAPVRTKDDLRSEEAQKKLEEIEAEQKSGASAPDKVDRRFREFAQKYSDTPQGRKVANRLESKAPKPDEPKVAQALKQEVPKLESPKPEIPKPEVPKPPEPPQAQPVVKPPEPAPVEPAVKPPPVAAKRQAVPDAAQLQAADARVRSIYRKEIDQAKNVKGKSSLARIILSEALRLNAKESELFVYLRLAQELAAQGWDVQTALEAIDARAAAFDVNTMGDKVDLIMKTTAKGADAAAWAQAALDVAEEVSEAEDYEGSVKLSSKAESLARLANDRGLEERTRAWNAEVGNMKRLNDGLKVHRKTLESKPDDPAANAAVGRFVSLAKADWARGLPMLAKSSEPALRALAGQELANPTDARDQLALGEKWVLQSEKETPTYKARARERAAWWLKRAVEGLTGVDRVSAERLLTSLGVRNDPRGPLTLELGGGVRMDLVFINAASFVMGSKEQLKKDENDDVETPQHRVTITRGYFLGKYEVTRGQFAAFVHATGYTTKAEVKGMGSTWSEGGWKDLAGVSWRDPKSFRQTDEHPAICISWYDAREFCNWAKKVTGREVRLPTEAEWEYACRAGTKTKWEFGERDNKLDEYGWFRLNSGMQTRPVGQKMKNAFGLYDMYGNAWEWCLDWSADYGEGDVQDPKGPSSGKERCMRGGGFDNLSDQCRSAVRHDYAPHFFRAHNGFRICVQ